MSAEESAEEEWDFLLSYTALDGDWAEWLAWQLESAGYRVLIRAWDCVPGSNWTTHVQVGIVGAKRILLVLSPAYLRSLVDEPEWQAAVAANPSGSERRLLPVRVQACEPVGLLARLTAIDLVGATREAASATLLRLVRHALDGRAKPPCEPAYPVRRAPGRDEPVFPAARGPAHGAGDAPGDSPIRAQRSPAAGPPGVDAARTLRASGRPDQRAARLSTERAPSARRRGKSDPGDPRRLAAVPRAIRPREPRPASTRSGSATSAPTRRPAVRTSVPAERAPAGSREQARPERSSSAAAPSDRAAPSADRAMPPPERTTVSAARTGPSAVPAGLAAAGSAVGADSWGSLPVARLVRLGGTTDAAVRSALDPLPDDAPGVLTYRPVARPSLAACQKALLTELEAAATTMYLAWLPQAAPIESTDSASVAAVRLLAHRIAPTYDVHPRYLASLAESALRGRPRSTPRFAAEARAAGVARTIAAGLGRTRLALLIDPAGMDDLRPAEQRVLLDALDWFAYHGRAGVWLTGRPGHSHDDRIRVLPCPAGGRPQRPLPPAAPGQVSGAANERGQSPPVLLPTVRGRPRPGSRAEQLLEAALSRRDWSHGRAWNQPHRSGPLSTLIYVDLAWFEERVVVEVDGPEHRGLAHYESDRRRDNSLGLQGFTILRFTNEMVLGDVQAVVEDIERCIRTRRDPATRHITSEKAARS